jgi:hypothetical protein
MAENSKESNAGGLCSPVTKTMGPMMPNLRAASGTYDRNPAPAFGKPRDMGPNSLPEKFTDGNLGGVVPGPGERVGQQGIVNPRAKGMPK